MGWGNLIIVMFMVYFTYKTINIFRTGTKNIKHTSKLLDEFREKKILTVEEQKQFIDLKFGRKIPGKFKWMSILHIFPTLFLFVFLFMGYNFLFSFIAWDISLWMALVFIMVAPVIFSIILRLLGLTDNNTLVDLFWKVKKK